GDAVAVALDGATTASLRALAKDNQTTLFVVLLSMFAALLHRYCAQRDFFIGIPTSGRTDPAFSRTVGYFVNPLPIRFEPAPGEPFDGFLRTVRRTVVDAIRHQELPFSTIVERLNPARELDTWPLYQVAFTLQSAQSGLADGLAALALGQHGQTATWGGIDVSSIRADERVENFDLKLVAAETDDGVLASFQFNRRRIAPETIQAMATHFGRCVDAIVGHSTVALRDLPLVIPADRGWPAKSTVRERAALPVHARVELQAFISPNAPAVVDDERTLSYRELNRAADQLAQRLTAGGVCLGDRVAIFLPRGTAFVVSALAIMKAGGVYLPIAPDTPGARAQAVIAQGEAIAVVTEPTNSAGLTEGGHNAIWFESSVRPPVGARQPASDCVPLASGAYLIFTSGSTGKPKGVGVSHGALNNLIDWHLRAYEIAPEHRASQVAGLGFDASVWEIWPYLVGGASVHVVSEANRLEPERLVNWLSTERITHAFLPTPLAEAVLSPAVESTSDLSQLSLQVLLTGGDRLGVLTCAAQAFRLVNHYGPTENAVVATCGDVGWGSTAIPTIGRAIDGVQSLILDESLNPMPDGCEGDLYVTGESLATGYFGQAALTAERFVPDPFGPGGARMYATGDRVARRANGELEFRGRRDDQLKVRGFRIEPAEIEAALRTHNVVRDAAVILKGGHDRRPTLTAYLLPEVKPDAASNRDLIESAHVDDWRSLYDATYAAPAIGDDASFNIVGWASSYDGEALPEREMAMWLDDIVELIAERPLGRVLEVGCGTGLLLARLARQSVAYVGTDISDVALQQGGEFADQAQLSHVTLVHAAADELGEIGDGFDTVILNSVVQYFPNQAYLERVCADLVRRVANGGRLIIGDVRDFNLLRAFHCDIAYSGTPSSTRVAQFSEDVQFQEAAEQELLVAPQFFSALGAQLPRLTGVELRLKPGAYHNELARFRFDAVLHVGDAGVDRGSARLREQSWTGPNDIEDLVLEMTAGTLGRVALRNIPNRRLQRAVALSKLSNEPRSRLRLSDIADSLGDCAERGCDPSDLVSLAASHGYRCYPFVAAAREPAHFDALFLPADGQVPYEYRRRDPTDQGVGVSGPFCNDPLRRRYQNSHVPSIRNAMAAVLPAYMVPDTYVFIDAFPLSPSGKVDRKALPAIADRKIDAPKQATTPLQSALVDIWEEVLGIAPIAINQNFFDLGGDSILSIQVISRARDRGIRIAPRQMFEHQTIESLADAVANQTSAGPDDAVKSSITLSDAERTRFQSDYQRWDGVFPVSPLQSGLWFHDQADAGSVYIEQLQILLRGRLDPDALRETLMDTLGAHPALRAGFDFLDDDTPVQVIGSLGQMSIPFYVLDLRGSAESETDDVRDRVDALLVDDYRQPFDLNRPPLMRVTLVRKASDEWLLIWTHHHLLLDGWSVPIVLREWFDRYSAKTAGDEFSSALPDPYLACLERLTGQSKAHEAAAGEYWAAQFDGFDGPTIVTDPVAPGAEATRGWAFAEAQWSREQSTAVTTFCREHRLTLNTVVQASVALALSTLGARRDVVFGAIESGRSIPVSGIETAVGLLISALPMRFDCNPGRDVLQWLREGQDRTLRSAEFGGYSLADISRWMGKRDQDPLFEVLVAFENYPVTDYVGQEFGDLALVDIDYRDQTHYPLTLVFSANETISLRVGYQTDRFRREWIARIGGLIEQYALEIVATGAHQTLGQLRTITGADAQRLTAWSRAETTYPRTDTLVERLQNEAARSPSRIALQHRDRTMTYRELAAQSDRYALALQREGIGRGAFVGLAMARGLELIVSLVAVLKTGAAYVPLETQHPTARLRELINANRIGWVICDEPNRAVSDCTARALLVETLRDDDRRLDRKQGSGREWNAIPITATDPAYVIFTSGSTGQPKGVVVTHQNVLRLFDALPEDLTISGDDVFSLAHSIAFDFSVWELWGALLFGGRCVVVDHDTVRDPQAFARDIREHGVSILSQTPSAFYELQDALTAQSRPPALRRVVFGGEALTTTRLRPWFAHFGDDERCFVNMYGITETTVHVTASTITADDAMQGRDSIGRPLSDLSAHVLDPFGRPMPLGVVGELFVGGAGVADGYLGRPGLTASRFVPDPFADSPGARLYRTGDLARWDEAGNLEYRGRIDRQVQLHGFRIESGEIEHTLSTLPTIRDVAVVVREESNRHELVAYVVGDRDEGSLRRFADAQLPAHMRPKFYVWLDTIPKTLNGKLDFASFPTVDVADGGGVMASNELEGTLTEIWCEVLSLDAIGVTDNFFAMGGDSILCMQVVNRAHRRGIVFTPKQLFEHQTIRELATVAGRPQGHRIVNAERPIGSTPLTPIQRWFFEQSLPEPNHWNQSVLVPIDASISVESLGNALNKVITRHANFRLQFSAQDGVWAQRYADAEPGVPIVTLDDAAGDAAIIATCAAAQASLDINQGRTLSGVVLPARGQTSRQLLLCAHHLIIDAVSWRVLLEDLQAEIDTPSNGEAPSWQSDSFQSWSNALRDYGNGQGLRAERVFWLNLTWDRVADLTLDYPERSNLERDFQHIVLTLGADETSRLTRDSAEAYNTRTTDLLLAALTRTLLSEGAGDALRVDVEGHGREDVVAGVDITRTVGWFTSQFPVLLHRANQSLRDDIVQTKESLRAIPNRGIGYGLLRYGDDEGLREQFAALPRASVSFNYLGHFDQEWAESSSLFAAPESIVHLTGAQRGGSNPRYYELDINIAVLAGELRLSWGYGARMSRERMEALAQAYLQELNALVAHCVTDGVEGFTPSDFPLANQLDQKTLDSLLKVL
ncbi:MAG: amino acid adenylation domain-containing protein, partial [Pseudomonadota bacterium]